MPEMPFKIFEAEASNSEGGRNLMDFRTAWNILKNHDFLAKNRNLIYGYGKVRFHNKFESFPHFMVKAALAYAIFAKNGDGLVTELDLSDSRTVDVVQIKDASNIIGYEIESEHNTKESPNGIDIVEVPLRRMPRKAHEGIKELMKWCQEIVV
jgi:hypothetical protein